MVHLRLKLWSGKSQSQSSHNGQEGSVWPVLPLPLFPNSFLKTLSASIIITKFQHHILDIILN